jgi:hypothetical protein
LPFLKKHNINQKNLNFSENAIKKEQDLYKSHSSSENMFKMPRILKNKKASQYQNRSLAADAALTQWPVRP